VIALAMGCGGSDASPNATDILGKSSAELSAQGFLLCGSDCGGSRFYVGYGRENTAQIGTTTDATGTRSDEILKNVRNAKPALAAEGLVLDERRVDLENGNRASSVHRFEKVQIGSLRKTETMVVEGTSAPASTRSDARLVWGDSFIVRSNSLGSGATVRMSLTRTVGGFGNPLTSDAFYDVRSNTVINGQHVPALFYSIAKAPGAGEVDVIVGTAVVTHEFDVKVGTRFAIEGELLAIDGVRGVVNSSQQLNGGDVTDYTLTFAVPSTAACLRSASGTYLFGACANLP
jgi:hypothetical protein